jgi:hypothetical protein
VGSRQQGRSGHGSAALPARRRRWTTSRAAKSAASRCASCCCHSPNAAAGRTDQPSRCRNHRLARRHLRAYPGAILIVTHDRYFLDNVTSWILELDRGRAFPMRAIIPRGWSKAEAAGAGSREDKARQRALEKPKASGSAASPKARQAKSKARIQRYEKMADVASRTTRARHRADHHPGGRAAGQNVIDFEHLSPGLWRQAADRRTFPSSCRPAALSA